MKSFSLKIDSYIDIITNSSSELFASRGLKKKKLISLIKSVYPNYSDEYDGPYSLTELFLDSDKIWYIEELFQKTALLSGLSSEKLFLSERSLDLKNPSSIDKIFDFISKNEITQDPYEIFENYDEIYQNLGEDYRWYMEYKLEYMKKISNKYNLGDSIYLLLSKDENPVWDYQEKLMEFMERHHLG